MLKLLEEGAVLLKKIICIQLSLLIMVLSPAGVFAEEYKPYVPSVLSSGTSGSSANNRVIGNAYVPGGAIIGCELVTPLNSGKNYKGERVQFKTLESVVVNNVTVIPSGTMGEAIVSDVSRAGAFGKGGRISLSTQYIKSLLGVEVPVSFEMSKSGGGQGGWAVPAFLVISVLAGFVRGKNQDLPAGTKFRVTVSNDTDLKVPAEDLARAVDAIVNPPNPQRWGGSGSNTSAKTLPDIMTVSQVAEYLQVSPEVIDKAIADGKMKATNVGGVWRIRKVDLDSYLGG